MFKQSTVPKLSQIVWLSRTPVTLNKGQGCSNCDQNEEFSSNYHPAWSEKRKKKNMQRSKHKPILKFVHAIIKASVHSFDYKMFIVK